LGNAPENNLNLFGTQGYRPPMGYGSLQKRPDLSSIPLNLPLFLKTSPVTSRVHSIEHLFKSPYAVKNCPEKPPASYIYKCHQTLKRSVKTRRKSLVSNKLNLQMAGSTRWQDGISNPGMKGSLVAWRKQTTILRRTKPHLGGRPCLIGSRGSRPRCNSLPDNKLCFKQEVKDAQDE
jgi:hypothetical protein